MMQQTKPILTITGSDPTGGSGIQADIKTITALGGYAVSAITSVTVQTTLGIQKFHDLPSQVVARQIEAFMNDVQPETVKVGLIRTVETVRAVVDALLKYHPRNIVYAPLSHSSQGEALIPADVEQTISQHLLPVCTLVLADAQFKSHGDTEAQILQAIEIDYIDESEVLSPADNIYHINKTKFDVPFVCGAKNLGEAMLGINEQEIELLMAERGK